MFNLLMQVAAPQMRRSTVVGHKGGGVVDNIRTSYGTFIKRLHDPVIARIEQKIAKWTNTTIAQQEDIQVLRYVDGQKYGAHQDGLGRLATIVMFLADTEEGVRPASTARDMHVMSTCCQKRRCRATSL